MRSYSRSPGRPLRFINRPIQLVRIPQFRNQFAASSVVSVHKSTKAGPSKQVKLLRIVECDERP